MARSILILAAGVPDAVRSEAAGRHEADLLRLLGLRDVVDADAGSEAARRVLQLVGGRAAEIGLLVALEFLHRPDARRVHRQQQILVRLQVKRARARRAGDEVDNLRVLRVAHVDGGDAVAEAVADVGVAAMHHDLHAVAPAAEVGVADEFDVLCRNRRHGESPPPRNNCPIRGSPSIACARSCMRMRPSSSTTPWSEFSKARLGFCSISRSVMPPLRNSCSRAKSSSTRIGDRPIEGSSISISRGCSMRPRAISRIFCSPPESVEAWWRALGRRTAKRSMTASMRAFRSVPFGAATPPNSRLCSTESSGKMLRPCGT